MYKRQDIATQAGMVKSCSQFFGVAAVSLVQANHVESGNEGFLGGAEHIAGFARPFQAVKQNQRWVGLRIFLPMAFSANLRACLDFEQARNAFVQARKFARPESCGDGHEVGIAKSFVRDEFFHDSDGRDFVRTTQATRLELAALHTIAP